MRVVHFHVLKATAFACLGGVLVFTFVILLSTVFRDMLEMLLEGRLTTAIAGKLCVLALPYAMIYALPIGLLTGIMLTLGRMSADNEIVAIRASGMGVAQLCSSIVALAGVAVLGALLVNLEFGPRARAQYREELAQAVSNNPLGFIVPRVFVKDFPGYVIYVGERKDELLHDLWVWKTDSLSRAQQVIRAEKGWFHYNSDSQELDLRLVNGTWEDRDSKDPEDYGGNSGHYLTFNETRLPLSLSSILGTTSFRRKLYWMPFAELLATRERLVGELAATNEKEGSLRQQLAEVRMTLQEKLSSSFASFSFALVGIPLGIVTKRRASSLNLFLALGLAFLYYISMMLIGWLESWYWLRPDLLYWLPNLLFQGLGLFLIVRLDRGTQWSGAKKKPA